MKVNIYYGGRGLLDDPTLYVLNKMEEVLKELRVTVERINIIEHKNEITTLPQTLKDADGIILGTTVEWLGIGGYMQQFLDACWLYGDKEKIKTTYMQPIVMSTTYGEREGELTLANAWEILGGLPCAGLCGYVEDLVSFEMNEDYTLIIEKKAESLYRTISQKLKSLPTSNQAVKQSVLRTSQMDLTPQESEQLSKYVSDDSYVKKQKEDIEELAQLFKEMLGDTEKKEEAAPSIQTRVPGTVRTARTSETGVSGMVSKELSELAAQMGISSAGTDTSRLERDRYFAMFQDRFRRGTGVNASFSIIFTDDNKNLVIEVRGDQLNCYHGTKEDADIIAKTTTTVVNSMFAGQTSMQKAFMTGALTAKGNFKTLRSFDTIFNFN